VCKQDTREVSLPVKIGSEQAHSGLLKGLFEFIFVCAKASGEPMTCRVKALFGFVCWNPESGFTDKKFY